MNEDLAHWQSTNSIDGNHSARFLFEEKKTKSHHNSIH